MEKLVKESLNEIISFERSGNPLSTLGIGQKALIEKWLNEMGIINDIIYSDFIIDVLEDVDLCNKFKKIFPKYIQFDKITGDFVCTENNLISLRGCPKYVNGHFACSHNDLSSLKYCPIEVHGVFWCNDNKVKFTKENVLKYCKTTSSFILT